MEDKQNRRGVRGKTEQAETRESVRLAMREADKKADQEKKKREQEKSPYNPFFNYHKRRFPIWQRLIALISLCAIALVGGAMFGYGALGHGSPWAVFDPATWQHILDFLRTN